jgi:hypothetical protein
VVVGHDPQHVGLPESLLGDVVGEQVELRRHHVAGRGGALEERPDQVIPAEHSEGHVQHLILVQHAVGVLIDPGEQNGDVGQVTAHLPVVGGHAVVGDCPAVGVHER